MLIADKRALSTVQTAAEDKALFLSVSHVRGVTCPSGTGHSWNASARVTTASDFRAISMVAVMEISEVVML